MKTKTHQLTLDYLSEKLNISPEEIEEQSYFCFHTEDVLLDDLCKRLKKMKIKHKIGSEEDKVFIKLYTPDCLLNTMLVAEAMEKEQNNRKGLTRRKFKNG